MLLGMARAVLYWVVGSVCSGVGAPGRKRAASLCSITASRSTTWIEIASFGHACTQAGASPWASRSLHMSHLRTIPRALLYLGASYGHINVQYWQPKHWS